MASKALPRIDVEQLQARFMAQFRGLDARDPTTWPATPRRLLYIALALGVIVLAWFLLLTSASDELEAAQAKEVTLKEDYKKKLAQAVNLDALKKQREQVIQYVHSLEKQLPGKAEIDALLSDINQAGLGRNLQFDLFRPGLAAVKDYYAELPIEVRVNGKYHDIGAFAADIAQLSRIVTLSNMSLMPGKEKDSGNLTFDATAKTFRYLDTDEIVAQRKATAGAKK